MDTNLDKNNTTIELANKSSWYIDWISAQDGNGDRKAW